MQIPLFGLYERVTEKVPALKLDGEISTQNR